MGIVVHSAIFGVLIPVFVGALIIAVNMFVFTKSSPSDEEQTTTSTWSWFGGLALAAAYAAGHIGLLQFPSMTTTGSIPRLFWCAVFAVGLAALESFLKLPTIVKWLVRVVFLGIVGYLMFGYIVAAGTWTTGKAALNISLMAGLGTLFWFLTEDATSEQTDTHTAWTYMLYALGLSIVLVLAESAKLAQLCGALVSGIGIWWVSSWFGARIGKSLSLSRGVAPVFIVLSVGLAAIGKFEANLHTASAFLLVVPMVLLALQTRFLQRDVLWQRIGLQAGLLLIPLIIAGALMLGKAPAKSEDKGDDAYDPYSSIHRVVDTRRA
ncbi:MAG TPA: hypothetical protein DCE42_20250 [Myxococcales bacterium]|nr:hypothetical protein [Deltaproteobacteria bacterium]HAA57108.1 hypothetical protein [Myxococcales bacterium]|tara:strand:+ start:1214 stop:2182 length:969 start_codon:yes stop_codon:yes gene_type:complete